MVRMRPMVRILWRAIVVGFSVVVLGSWFPCNLSAQVTGTMAGFVTDPSGAIVPNAKVTAILTRQGASRSGESNGEGFYGFEALLPGTYTLTVEKAGFERLDTPMNYPPPDAIQEFRIETSNFASDYGRNVGSQVTVVAKSGTNGFHGSAWEFVRNDIFNARNYFASTVPTIKENQFGGAAGGPIKKTSSSFLARISV